jgi:SAM-dependent methyltransferase
MPAGIPFHPRTFEIVPAGTVLHVGCGPQTKKSMHQIFHSDAWKEVRLDINADVNPDIIGTMTDMGRVETGSVDAIWSSHNVEHLFPHEVHLALREFHRVLKPHGFAVIGVPDLQEVARLVVEDKLEDPAYQSPAGPICPIDTLYGLRTAIARGNHYMAHKTGFTAKTLSQYIIRAGFAQSRIRKGNCFDLWSVAYVSAPAEAAPPSEQPVQAAQ